MKNNSFSIIPVTTGRVSELAALSRQTFHEAFAAVNEETYMNAYMDTAYSAKNLIRELENPESLFFFVEDGNTPIAYLKVNFNEAQSDLQDPGAMEIERIYVLEAYLGKGIGRLMMDHALDLAVEANVRYVWLGVWEHNDRALQFYRKNGFEVFGDHSFWLGDDEQTDLLMRRDL